MVVNLLTKAITAPFSLLFGGGHDDMGYVAFDPGSARLTPQAQDKLDKIAWDEAFTYIAKGLKAIATRYSGAEGAKLPDHSLAPDRYVNATGALAEEMRRLEEQSDELHDQGVKALFLAHRSSGAIRP